MRGTFGADLNRYRSGLGAVGVLALLAACASPPTGATDAAGPPTPRDAGPGDAGTPDAGGTVPFHWVQAMPALSPPARTQHAMAYDSARAVTLLFGGEVVGGTYVNDTWTWDGTNWAQLSPATSPSGRRAYGCMAFDSRRGVAVLFAGQGSNEQELNDTWEWDGTSWTQRSPPTSPPARGTPATVYDSRRGVTVLFGGLGAGYLNDTWEYDGTNWTQRSPATSPPARAWHAMAYDGMRAVTVLFGGDESGSTANDTWEWDGTNWSKVSPAKSLPDRSGQAMAYDSARGSSMIFGGYWYGSMYPDDVWEWDGSTWAQSQPSPAPTSREEHAMAYDAARGVTVLFGGSDATRHVFLADTWEWTAAVGQ